VPRPENVLVVGSCHDFEKTPSFDTLKSKIGPNRRYSQIRHPNSGEGGSSNSSGSARRKNAPLRDGNGPTGSSRASPHGQGQGHFSTTATSEPLPLHRTSGPPDC
jgi:hypothetical protein